MDLNKQIKQYYFDNLDQISKDKQFHLATRLAAWEGDKKANQLLLDLKAYILPSSDSAGIKNELRRISKLPRSGKQNAANLREEYFIKYPDLYGMHSALFRVRHLKAVYGIDSKNELFSIYELAKFEDLARQLINDEGALRILSTFAVNYLYLLYTIVLERPDEFSPDIFIEAARGYNLDDRQHIQLLIYLYTHCVIGDSNFYTKHVNEKNLAIYAQMMSTLEELISTNYQEINLDNKLEFLVCCRIINFESALFSKIEEECQRSVSDHGTYLIDRHNNNAQADRSTLERSEHRNVLYIMSKSPYRPHSTLAA